MRLFDETNTYEEIINEINTGDNISLSSKNFNLIKINGEVRSFYLDNSRFYLTVYDFFKREEKTYILTRDIKLRDPLKLKKFKRLQRHAIANFNYNSAGIEDSHENKIKKTAFKIFSIIVIIVFLLTTIPFKISFVPTSYDYREFLSKNLTIYQLYNVVTARLTYVADVYDEWMTPEYAWTMKSGDCEEYSNIISDYLNNHGIKNYVVGLNIKNSAVGHAVVFVRIDKDFYIMDPTRAVESAGVLKLNNIKNLKDAVKMYSTLPVDVFKVPSVNYEKIVIDTIY